MKSQTLFSGDSKKNISKFNLLNLLPSMVRVESSVACQMIKGTAGSVYKLIHSIYVCKHSHNCSR